MERQLKLSSIRFKDEADKYSNVRFSKLRKSIYGAKTIIIKQSKSFQRCLLFTVIIQFIIIIGMCFIVDWPKQIDNINALIKSNFQGENIHVKSRVAIKGNIVFGNRLHSNIIYIYIFRSSLNNHTFYS